jgi:uncharacterized protein YkwD
MRRAMALATATAAWVLLIQAASMAMAPPTLVELSPVDVSQDDVSQDSGGLSFEPGLVPGGPATIVVPVVTLGTTTTTISALSTTTLAAPSTTTTQAAPVTTTTRPPATTTTTRPPAVTTTTLPPTTTTAPPATTTTAPPAPTTTAPPATTTTVPAAAGGFSAAAESDFASRINGLRSSQGLASLAGSGELNNYARWWAKQMADTGNFAHSDIGSLLNPWTVVGENIGYGPSVSSVFNALVASPGHYKNMVDARFTAVGVGAFVDATGRIWTAHVFGG